LRGKARSSLIKRSARGYKPPTWRGTRLKPRKMTGAVGFSGLAASSTEATLRFLGVVDGRRPRDAPGRRQGHKQLNSAPGWEDVGSRAGAEEGAHKGDGRNAQNRAGGEIKLKREPPKHGRASGWLAREQIKRIFGIQGDEILPHESFKILLLAGRRPLTRKRVFGKSRAYWLIGLGG
jgi:hypothetical protein